MEWVLRLVETGIDGPARVIDVTDLKPTGSLGDIGNLGLTLPEAKLLLGQVQQVVVWDRRQSARQSAGFRQHS
jgi:hypothetical protein